VVDENGQSIPGVKISLYQAVTGDGSSGPYSQEFDNIPDISGVTNDQGIVSLGSLPFGDLYNIGTPAGVALIRMDNPENGEYRYIWIELIDFNMAYWQGETNLYQQEVVYPSGPLTLNLSDNNVTFTAFPGMIGLTPKSVQISINGDGVAYWRLEPTSVPWLKTIPMSDQDDFPPGPLDIIADPTGLSTGTYSTTITIDAWEGVANCPATINVNMNVINPYIVNLPQVYHSPP
jgi:hypothetical protein